MSSNATSDPVFLAAVKQANGVVGIVAILVNLFILFVFASNKRLRKSSALLVAMTIAHVFNGAVNVARSFWPSSNSLITVSPLYCMKVVWPNLYYTTFQILPLFLGIAGVERLLALAKPMWYRTKCTHRRMWMVAVAVFAYGLVSVGINCIVAWQRSNLLISASCTQTSIFGTSYMNAGSHFPAVLGGLCATLCTAVGLHIGRKQVGKLPAASETELARARKHIRLAKCLLMISAIDMVCVVIPNIVLILYNWGMLDFPFQYTTLPALVYILDSALNIVAFVLFNSEFKKAALKLLRCGMGGVASTTMGAASETVQVQRRGVKGV